MTSICEKTHLYLRERKVMYAVSPDRPTKATALCVVRCPTSTIQLTNFLRLDGCGSSSDFLCRLPNSGTMSNCSINTEKKCDSSTPSYATKKSWACPIRRCPVKFTLLHSATRHLTGKWTAHKFRERSCQFIRGAETLWAREKPGVPFELRFDGILAGSPNDILSNYLESD